MFQFFQVSPEFIGGLIEAENSFVGTWYIPKEVTIQRYALVNDRQHRFGDLRCPVRCLTERIEDRIGPTWPFVALVRDCHEFHEALLGRFIAVFHLYSGKRYVTLSIRNSSFRDHVGASSVTCTTLKVFTFMEHQEDTL